MVARTRLGARQTRRHLQRSACCRQPVDRRTTRPDRGRIARTNPHADKRPFRQRVTRFGHVPAYRASRPLSQHCRGSASGKATARSRIHRRNRMRPPKSKPPAPGSYDRTCKTSPMRATSRSIRIPSGLQPFSGRRPQYPNQRVEVSPVLFRLSDSCRTPRAPGRIFSKLPAKSGLRTGPGPNAPPLSPVPSLLARLRQARTGRGNMGKAQRGSTSPKDFAVPAV